MNSENSGVFPILKSFRNHTFCTPYKQEKHVEKYTDISIKFIE